MLTARRIVIPRERGFVPLAATVIPSSRRQSTADARTPYPGLGKRTANKYGLLIGSSDFYVTRR
jgi:hypothetical protein